MRTESPTAHEREQMIGNVIWTFAVEGVEVTIEEAEAALDWALRQPLPEL